jgi:dTDP-4-dehydrorhamnose reductase
LVKGQAIRVVSDQLRTPTYAGDLAAAIFRIALERRAGTWHISGKDRLSPYDVALKVAAYAGLDASLITRVDASVFTQPAQRPRETPFIIEKARRELGYEPVGFEEGMRKVIGQRLEVRG